MLNLWSRKSTRKPGETLRVHPDWAEPGSLEHYWHYLFGVVLPLTALYCRRPDRLRGARLLLESCGPAMDPLLGPLGLECTMEVEDGSARIRREPVSFHRLRLTLREFRHRAGLSPDWVPGIKGERIHLPRWDAHLKRHGDEDAAFVQCLQETSRFLVELAANDECCGTRAEGAYLLLRRSSPSAYFQPGGPAGQGLYGGYGSSRRSLSGLEDCRDALQEAGIHARIYEPGAHGLPCQIRQFASAQGIVGIRGAEFAGMVWMHTDALVVMVAHGGMENPPQRALARAMGLNHYREVNLGDGLAPLLDSQVVGEIIADHRDGAGLRHSRDERHVTRKRQEAPC
ncbi:MAG: hypothetical protein RL434_2718 [Pseudomonadota bacterium]